MKTLIAFLCLSLLGCDINERQSSLDDDGGKFFSFADRNRNDVISLSEFQEAINAVSPGLADREMISDTFICYDSDGDGLISRDELRQLSMPSGGESRHNPICDKVYRVT